MAFIELKVLNNVAQPILGIDLGTTNSLVAIWRDGRPVVLRPDPRDSRIPSVIHFPEKGDPIVGRAAREYALSEPGSNIFSVKRFMGRGLADVGDDVALVPYPVGETENDVLQFDVNGRKYTPQELSALILMHVHDVACKQLEGGMIDRVVLTVPAYFDDTQRQATRDAARLAELEVVRIINEPTAASLAYGLDQRKDGTIAVYDLGGGTFDVSILSIEEGVFRVLATAGDTHLGGDDIDHALMELALEDLRPKVGAETASDPAFLQGLKLAAEKCKIELSRAPEADFHFVVPEKSLTWHRRIMREELGVEAEVTGVLHPYLEWKAERATDGSGFLLFLYRLRLLSRDFKLLESEITEARWAAPADWPGLPMLPYVRALLEERTAEWLGG